MVKTSLKKSNKKIKNIYKKALKTKTLKNNIKRTILRKNKRQLNSKIWILLWNNDERNLISNAYDEELAKELYKKI